MTVKISFWTALLAIILGGDAGEEVIRDSIEKQLAKQKPTPPQTFTCHFCGAQYEWEQKQ